MQDTGPKPYNFKRFQGQKEPFDQLVYFNVTLIQ